MSEGAEQPRDRKQQRQEKRLKQPGRVVAARGIGSKHRWIKQVRLI
jgi:hypothetical protein